MLQPINWINLLKAPAGGFSSAEYQAVYDSFTTKPSDDVAAAQNTMVTALVDSGVWAKMNVFWVFAQESNGDGEALKNWKNPGTFDATLVNAPTHTSLEGIAGNGTTSYIRTNFIPSSDGIGLSQNDTSFGVYIRTNLDDSQVDIGGGDGTQRYYFISRSSGTDLKLYSVNDNISDSSANTDSRGCWILTRDELANVDIYLNGALDVTDARASVGVPTKEIYICCHNNNGSPASFTAKQQSMAFISTQLDLTDVGNFTTAFETYMDSNGKGVIA